MPEARKMSLRERLRIPVQDVVDAVSRGGLASGIYSVAWSAITGKPSVNTTAPLTGGGSLASSLTLAVSTMTGDSGAGGARGVVPAPAAGDTAAGKFLKASGTWVTPPVGAPDSADYLVKTANGSLSAERVVTNTTSVTWDWSTAGQAKATVTASGVSHAGLADRAWGSSGHTGTASRLAGFDGSGNAAEYAIGTDVQAYDADLAAIAGLSRTRGDLIRGGAAAWERVALGTAGQVLGSNGTDAAWRNNPLRYEYVGTTSYYVGGPHLGGALSTSGTIAKDLYKAYPWVAPRSGTIDQLAVDVTTSVALCSAVVALWSDSSGAPGSVLGQATLDCSSTGVKTGSVTVTIVQGTTYWFTFLCSVTNLVTRAPGEGGWLPAFGHPLGANTLYNKIQVAQAYASPTPAWPGGASLAVSTPGTSANPTVFYRWSA